MRDELLRKGKALLLDYTRGMTRCDFTERSVDPQFIFDLALEGEYTGLIVNPGVAERYWKGAYRDVALVIRLDAHVGERTVLIASVERAVKLGAAGVALTMTADPESAARVSGIAEEAHDRNLPLLITNAQDAQGVRAALELGADMVCAGDHDLSWLKRCAGRSRLLVREEEQVGAELLDKASQAVIGADGLIVGQNLSEHERPFSMSKALGEIVYRRKRPEQVRHLLQNV